MEKSRIRPFSNGTQFADWENRNCDRCRLAPRGEFAQYRCPIQKALGLAYWDSGDVSQKIADRMGYKPEENRYTWDCPERVPREKPAPKRKKYKRKQEGQLELPIGNET